MKTNQIQDVNPYLANSHNSFRSKKKNVMHIKVPSIHSIALHILRVVRITTQLRKPVWCLFIWPVICRSFVGVECFSGQVLM